MIVAIPESLYTDVQRIMRTTPLVLAGSGFSCAFGMPSMWRLGEHLSAHVEGALTTPEAIALWQKVLPDVTLDLEAGLNTIPLAAEGREELLSVLRAQTASLISDETERAENAILNLVDPGAAAPARLFRHLFSGAPQNAECISVITTNYDTLIELFCDISGLPIDTGFSGYRRRQVRQSPLFPTTYSRTTVTTGARRSARYDHQPCRNVRILKPHGSITWHQTAEGPVEILNGYAEHPKAIVVPGPSKYEDALVNTLFDAMRSEMNQVVNRASALLCLGFGFNDVHLQGVIESRLQAGMPALVLTKDLTPNIKLALGRHKHLIAISESPDGSFVDVGGSRVTVSENIWMLDNFLKTFVE